MSTQATGCISNIRFPDPPAESYNAEIVRIERAVQEHSIVVLNGDHGPSSSLALEYARQKREFYSAIFLLHAGNPAQFASCCSSIYRLLKCPSDSAQSRVRNWLEKHTNWLLLIDDLEVFNGVEDFLAEPCSGHAILVPSSQECSVPKGKYKSIQLGPSVNHQQVEQFMDRADTRDLLMKLAFFAPRDIPMDLILGTGPQLPWNDLAKALLIQPSVLLHPDAVVDCAAPLQRAIRELMTVEEQTQTARWLFAHVRHASHWSIASHGLACAQIVEGLGICRSEAAYCYLETEFPVDAYGFLLSIFGESIHPPTEKVPLGGSLRPYFGPGMGLPNPLRAGQPSENKVPLSADGKEVLPVVKKGESPPQSQPRPDLVPGLGSPFHPRQERAHDKDAVPIPAPPVTPSIPTGWSATPLQERDANRLPPPFTSATLTGLRAVPQMLASIVESSLPATFLQPSDSCGASAPPWPPMSFRKEAPVVSDSWTGKALVEYKVAALRLFRESYGPESPEAALAHYYLGEPGTADAILQSSMARIITGKPSEVLTVADALAHSALVPPLLMREELFKRIANEFLQHAEKLGNEHLIHRAQRFASVAGRLGRGSQI